jgi:hypothetical protein
VVLPVRARLVIVEGTCGAGKSTLLGRIPGLFACEQVRLFSQRDTYAPIVPAEDAGSLDDRTNLLALRGIVGCIRAAVGGHHLVVADTLHATHLVRAGALSLSSFDSIDAEVRSLGALNIILRLSIDSIRRRTIVGRRDTGFYQYAQRFGATEDALTSHFYREQERVLDLLAVRSKVPFVILNGDEEPEHVARQFAAAVRLQSSGR